MAALNLKETKEFYGTFLKEAKEHGPQQLKLAMRELALRDLFFLLYHLLNRKDLDHPWLFERCREVQANPNGYLDLWAREHRKSTIITFGLTIQDILWDPELTIGIFSLTHKLAIDFLGWIKTEFETNVLLRHLFPDILWDNPAKEALSWSIMDGITVKRTSNARENTVEAYGLVEGLPTGKHFKLRIYDDVIDQKNVTNSDMIKKAISSWRLSQALGSDQICKRYGANNLSRIIGTRYHFNDPYGQMIKDGSAHVRIYPAVEGGDMGKDPVYFSKELLSDKRRRMGPYDFGCQYLLDPKADEVQGFKSEWLRYWRPENWEGFNRYLLVDPAGEKKKENDYTVISVIGLGMDGNYYLIDAIRDRLNLTERTQKLFEFHRTYQPMAVGYEKYGKDSDIEHVQYVQQKENYRFDIMTLGGPTPKNDRIRKLIPIFGQGRFYIPERLHFVDHERRTRDFTNEFINDEFHAFPVGVHDDMLDNFARIVDEDLHAVFPNAPTLTIKLGAGRMASGNAWMGA